MAQMLDDFLNDEGQPATFPSECIVIDLFPLSKGLVDMRPSGKLVPDRGFVSHVDLIPCLPAGAEALGYFNQRTPSVRAVLIANQ